MLDLRIFTAGDVTKNQPQIMKLLKKFILSFLNWIQDLEHHRLSSCLSVSFIRWTWIF